MNMKTPTIAVIGAWLAVVSTGCVRPVPIHLSPAAAEGAAADGSPRRYRQARITLRDGALVDLRRVRVTGDSVLGDQRFAGLWVPSGFARSDIAGIEGVEFSPERTLLALGALGLGAFALYGWMLSQALS